MSKVRHNTTAPVVLSSASDPGLLIDDANKQQTSEPMLVCECVRSHVLLVAAAGDAVVVSRLKELVVTSGSSWAFVPLHPSPSFEAWAGKAAATDTTRS
jgi:hypothetical protein